jgi:hypothetical protein
MKRSIESQTIAIKFYLAESIPYTDIRFRVADHRIIWGEFYEVDEHIYLVYLRDPYFTYFVGLSNPIQLTIYEDTTYIDSTDNQIDRLDMLLIRTTVDVSALEL